MKRLSLAIIIGLCLLSPVKMAAAETLPVKELNFVFLHGAGGNSCSMQLLSDTIQEQLPAYTLAYEKINPGTTIKFDSLLRCYPNDVDIQTWAENIADAVNTYLPDSKNLVLVGHSMGGKAALYAVAQNVGNLADKVILVVTIDSPIKSLQDYYFSGGATAVDYYRAQILVSDRGVSNSVIYYDSSADGKLVAQTKHWLAFIAAESAPLSPQFNVGGIDTLPRNMDDNIIPISAQYAEGADVVYYGEHSHNDFAEKDDVAALLAERILRYIFGGYIECSVFAQSGSFEHKAGWLPGADLWEDVVGETLGYSGSVQHWNESYISWKEWVDIVGEAPSPDKRSSYQISLAKHLPLLASVEEWRWFKPDDPYDCRIYIRTRAAPRCHVQVDWSIYISKLLPVGTNRDRYEVEIVTGTPLTNIERVSWVSDDTRDLRMRIWSEAESPFRWFQAQWQVYTKEIRYRNLIDQIPSS